MQSKEVGRCSKKILEFETDQKQVMLPILSIGKETDQRLRTNPCYN